MQVAIHVPLDSIFKLNHHVITTFNPQEIKKHHAFVKKIFEAAFNRTAYYLNCVVHFFKGCGTHDIWLEKKMQSRMDACFSFQMSFNLSIIATSGYLPGIKSSWYNVSVLFQNPFRTPPRVVRQINAERNN